MEESTIKFYEELKTDTLKNLLKRLETVLYNTEIIMNQMDKNGDYIEKIKDKIVDYEIDISLLRMELNKRLWNEL